MSKRGRRSYDNEFKREAVRLVVEEGRKASEVERNLEITPTLVARWVGIVFPLASKLVFIIY